MTAIRLLPPELTDKIAAGEVVERPASVVKELIENSLDAAADKIQASFDGGGLRSIIVRDNGLGMDPQEVRLAIQRHATSKIKDEVDLFRVASFGFRGEALPAIASVSKMAVTTRPAQALEAFRIEIKAGQVMEEGLIGAPCGTTVQVDDLFFNTPARLKFLKSHRTESTWIKETFIRLALANPEIYFQLSDPERTLLTFGQTSQVQDRLVQIFGAEAFDSLIEFEEHHPAVRVKGWISPPEQARASSRSIYAFVNKRFVRDRLVLGSLLAGFEGRLEKGRYPLAVVFLDLEPGTVDVNVHPTKLEVRFHHSQAIHLAIRRAVAEALGSRERFGWRPPQGRVAEPRLSVAETPAAFGQETNRLFSASSLLGQDQALSAPDQDAPKGEAPSLSAFRYLGQYAGTYLIGQSGGDLALIDQHAAHERIIYERLHQLRGQSQPLLLAAAATLTPRQSESLTSHLNEARQLGLDIEAFGPGKGSIVVKALPLVLAGLDPVALVRDLADELSETPSARPLEKLCLALARLACRAALKSGQEMSPEKVEALLDDLARLSGPLTCPHGRPIIRRITRAEVDRSFRRS